MKNKSIMKKLEIKIICVVLVIGSVSGCAKLQEHSIKKPEMHTIKITDPVDGKISSAASANTENPSESDIYNKPLDYYNGGYDDSVLLIKGFETYQQTSEYSCGPACIIMVLNHYGIADVGEDLLAREMDARYYDDVREDGSYGTTTSSMAEALSNRGLQVQTSKDTQDENGYSFLDISDFTSFIKGQLKEENPIITENVEWGGHWMVLIGYDDMDTNTFLDDTLIFADPYDVSDQYQDGYIEKNCYRYYSEWFDNNILPVEEQIQQYVTVIK